LSAQWPISFLAFGAETNEFWIFQRLTMTTLLAYQTIPDRSHDLESVTLDTVWAVQGLCVVHKDCWIVHSALRAKRFMCDHLFELPMKFLRRCWRDRSMATPPMFAVVVRIFSQGVTLALVVGGLLTFSPDSSVVSHGDGYALRAGIAYRSAPIGILSDRSRVTKGCQT